MENHELRSAGPPETVDNTIRSTYNQCPRKLYWFLRRFDYDPETKPPYFVWGAAWQEILTVWYNVGTQTTPGTHPHMVRAAQALRAGWDYWDRAGCFESSNNTRKLFELKWEAYLHEYPTEDFEFTPDSMEVGWRFPLVGTPYFYGGSLDGGGIRWPGVGTLVIENKTSGSYLSDNHIASWRYSPQIKGYCWYASQIMGEDFHGVLMNLMTKMHPGPRSNWKTPLFARTIVKLEPWHLEEFETDLRKDIQRIENSFSDWYWPLTTDFNNCTGGAGKAPCLFRHLCLSDRPYYEEDPTRYSGICELQTAWEPWLRESDQGVQE